MSRWSDEFKAHPIHQTLKALDASVIDAQRDNTDPKAQQELRRIGKILRIINKTIGALDPEMPILDHLNEMHGKLKTILKGLNYYCESKELLYLSDTDNSFRALWVRFLPLLVGAKKIQFTKESKQIENLADQFEENIAEKVKNLSENVDAEHLKLEELSQLIDKNTERTDSLLSSWEEQHSEAQKERQDIFTTWKQDIDEKAETEIETLVTDSTTRLESAEKEYNDEIERLKHDAEEKHEKIMDLYGIVASDGIAGEYRKNADSEGTQAKFWRWVSIIFIALTVCWMGSIYIGLGSSFIASGSDAPGWYKMLQTISMTGVLLFGAAFSAKQSAIHRKEEIRTRRFALEVNALDPFIASLHESDQSALKNKLADRFFGQIESTEKNKADFNMAVKVIKEVLKANK